MIERDVLLENDDQMFDGVGRFGAVRTIWWSLSAPEVTSAKEAATVNAAKQMGLRVLISVRFGFSSR